MGIFLDIPVLSTADLPQITETVVERYSKDDGFFSSHLWYIFKSNGLMSRRKELEGILKIFPHSSAFLGSRIYTSNPYPNRLCSFMSYLCLIDEQFPWI
jgi:hypothetical protein